MSPQYPQPSHLWLAQQLEGVKADAAALKAQTTQYIVDEMRVCQAIIGNLATAPTASGSENTGLQGWGLGARNPQGQWVSIGGGLQYGSAYVEWTSTGTESARREIHTSFPHGELAMIQLTGVGNAFLFRVYEGGPYNNVFRVVAHGPTDPTVGAGTTAYFYWLAIGN